MDFRAAARRTAGAELSEYDSMDGTMQDVQSTPEKTDWQPGVETDGQDPATPGGPSPFNGAGPQESEPVATDPLWKDPKEPNVMGSDMPHIQGPNQEANTLHNARRTRYESRIGRVRKA